MTADAHSNFYYFPFIFPASSLLFLSVNKLFGNCYKFYFTFPSFCHFQHFKIQQTLTVFNVSKDNRLVCRVGFLREEQGKSKRQGKAAFAITRVPRTKMSIYAYREKSENWE